MQKVIILTEEEYEALLNTQNEPSALLQMTIDNQKKSLDIALGKITRLEGDLSMYVRSGAEQRKTSMPETFAAPYGVDSQPKLPQAESLITSIIDTWNAETSLKVVSRSEVVAQKTGVSAVQVRGVLRLLVKEGAYVRDPKTLVFASTLDIS